MHGVYSTVPIDGLVINHQAIYEHQAIRIYNAD